MLLIQKKVYDPPFSPSISGKRSKLVKENGGVRLLLRWVVGEGDALRNVALQAFYTSLEECLFVLVEVREWVESLLSTGRLKTC